MSIEKELKDLIGELGFQLAVVRAKLSEVMAELQQAQMQNQEDKKPSKEKD